MSSFVLGRYQSIAAAATATAVTISLVTVPPGRSAPVSPRIEIAAVQLQAAVSSSQVAALVNATAGTTPPAAAADPLSPQASATGSTDTLAGIALAAIALVAAPFWYIAFPVTLPLSIFGAITLLQFANALPLGFGGGGQGDPLGIVLTGAVFGLGAFAIGPLGIAIGQIASLFTPTASAIPAATQRTASSETTAAAAAAAATTSSSATSERDASSTAPTQLAVEKPSTKAVRADTRSAKPSPASAITATAVAESLTDYADAPMTDSVTDAESGSATQESGPIREGSKGGSDRTSDRSGASRDHSRR